MGRSGRRWKDSGKMYLKEIWCDDVDWIRLAQNMFQWRTVVDMVMDLQVA
jgi:hypothetical protein